MKSGARSYPPAPGHAPLGEPRVAEGGRRDVLTFSIGNEEYALGIDSIREIIKNRPITEVPRVPPFVAGIIAVRGVVMPVIDLRIRLRLQAPPLSDKARILVVTHPSEGEGRDLFGLLVDRVHHVVRLFEQDVEPPLMLAGHEEFVAGIGRVQRSESADPRRPPGAPAPKQRHMLILLDLPRVLSFEHGGALHGASQGLLEGARRGAALAPKEKTA